MILDELRKYYENNVGPNDDQVTPRFYMQRRAIWELVVDRNGAIKGFYSLVSENDKNGIKLIVPAGQRSVDINPYVYFDDFTYLFGLDPKRGETKRQETLKRHHEVLDGVDDEGAQALLGFLDHHANIEELEAVIGEKHNSKNDKDIITFRLEGDNVRLHDRPALKAAWERYNERKLLTERPLSVDLVTGQMEQPRARLFPQVTGFPRAQSSGASLVGANAEAFRSYGQLAGDIGAISQESADKAANALSFLAKSPEHRLRIGNDEILFWADSTQEQETNALLLMLGSPALKDTLMQGTPLEDKDAVEKIQEMLVDVRKGKRPLPFDSSTAYHIVGIAPNNARLSLRFYESGTMGDLEERVKTFLDDTEMVGVRPFTIGSCLRQTAPLGKWEELPHPLIASTFNAYLQGTAFPDALYLQVIARTRVDHGSKQPFDMGIRAAILKACLLRKARFGATASKGFIERSLTVALNEDNDNIGYLLGRLFALLEKAQTDAGGKLNKTIRDSYMGAAATTPGRVFPRLLNMASHHVSKAEYGGLIDQYIENVFEKFYDGFPATLDYEDQGWFYIGYYQQRSKLYESKSRKDSQENQSDNNEEMGA